MENTREHPTRDNALNGSGIMCSELFKGANCEAVNRQWSLGWRKKKKKKKGFFCLLFQCRGSFDYLQTGLRIHHFARTGQWRESFREPRTMDLNLKGERRSRLGMRDKNFSVSRNPEMYFTFTSTSDLFIVHKINLFSFLLCFVLWKWKLIFVHWVRFRIQLGGCFFF